MLLYPYHYFAIWRRCCALFAVLILLTGCSENLDALQDIKHNGKLVVLIINSPSAYYYDRDDQLAGPEYEMTQSFAKHLGVNVEYKAYDSTRQILAAMQRGEGHIAAAGLTVNDNRKKQFDFGPAYQTLQEKLICHRHEKDIKDVSDLESLEVVVSGDSSYIETLKKYPGINWRVDDKNNTQYLLNAVANKNIQCTVSDTTLFYIERRYHTELEDMFTLSDNSELAWMVQQGEYRLQKVMDNWFDEYKVAELQAMLDRYYGYVEIFDYVDTHKFLRRVNTRFNKYKKYFVDAANKNDIEPALLAAQSYQESHWDPKAISPTGVRGIMMLTLPVARSLGVKSRLNAKQNIYAGAEFHAKMRKMVAHVAEPDRTWLTLAAYNVGRGHFRDAQSLAQQLGKDPDKWNDMKEVLPLLADKKYYKKLRYGYARGNEPVTYVNRIRNYEKLLHRHFEEI